ncbi:MAG: IPT/TIG domain-containing protein [Candidatus Daviesbacteria bacterium]|nr:IPT/TIG domain-containing protein [Candidatus Daviesbacteria bacterium]
MRLNTFQPLIIVVLLVAGAYFYKNYFQVSIANQNSQVTPTIDSQPTVTPIASPSGEVSKKTPSPTPTKIKPSPSISQFPQRGSSSIKIDLVTPSEGKIGDEIILAGLGFGPVMGEIILYNAKVGFDTPWMRLTPNRWTETEIKVTVPTLLAGNQTIYFEVQHKDGRKSNFVTFMVKGGQPRIDDISPRNAQPLQNIKISGKDFGAANGSVNFTEITNFSVTTKGQCEIVSWSQEEISCKIPSTVNNSVEYGVDVKSADGRQSSIKFYKVGS